MTRNENVNLNYAFSAILTLADTLHTAEVA
jgi:hypothetical protein